MQVLGDEGVDEAITITEISKCLPVIEHMSFYRFTVEVIFTTCYVIDYNLG